MTQKCCCWNYILRSLKHQSKRNYAPQCIGAHSSTAAQFTIAKYWKQPKCPSANEWIKKLWCIYTMKFYAAERKKELLLFATAWMELESIMLSEISQMVKDKYHMISPLPRT